MDDVTLAAAELALADAARSIMDRTEADTVRQAAASAGVTLDRMLADESDLPVEVVSEVVDRWRADEPEADLDELSERERVRILAMLGRHAGEEHTEEQAAVLSEPDDDELVRKLRAEGVPVDDPRHDAATREELGRRLRELRSDDE